MKNYFKVITGIIIGAILGYAYYYFFGCNSNSCALNSSWYFPTIFGAIAGLILSFPSNHKNIKEKNENDNH